LLSTLSSEAWIAAVVKDGRATLVDEEKMRSEGKKAARQLWMRATAWRRR